VKINHQNYSDNICAFLQQVMTTGLAPFAATFTKSFPCWFYILFCFRRKWRFSLGIVGRIESLPSLELCEL